MPQAISTYRQATAAEKFELKVNQLAGRIQKYRKKYPESEISTECLARHFAHRRSRVVHDTGALYLEDVGLPVPEFVGEPETENIHIPEKVNHRELTKANISYDIVSEDNSFTREHLEWWDSENGLVVVEVVGELRGIKEFEVPNPVLHEPLTEPEAIEFIASVFSPEWCSRNQEPLDDEEFAALAKLTTQTLDMLSKMDDDLVTRTQMVTRRAKLNRLLQMAWEAQEDNPSKALYARFEGEWNRIRACVKRESIGGDWSFSGRYFIGEREGVIYDQTMQNDIKFTKQEQFHQLGERIDGKFVHSEELWRARYGFDPVFSQMFGGYVRNKEDKWVEVQRAPDGGVGNRGNTGQRLYLRRRAQARAELCLERVWHILTWPKEWLELVMEGIRDAYRNSIRENAPGPGRRRIESQWLNVPLEGDRAIAWIRERGVGTLAGRKVHPEIKAEKGESWHKTILNRDHLAALEEAYKWRMEKGYDGLPQEYVKEEYLRARSGGRTGEEGDETCEEEGIFYKRPMGTWTSWQGPQPPVDGPLFE